MITIVKRYHKEELETAINDLEKRGFTRASEIVRLDNERKTYINNRFLGTNSNGVGFMIKMRKGD